MTVKEITKAVNDGKRVVTEIDELGYWEVYSDLPFGYIWYHHGKCAMTNGTWYLIDSEVGLKINLSAKTIENVK